MERAEREMQPKVLEILQELSGIEPLKELFWSELSYQRVNIPLPRHGWTPTAADALAEDPVVFAVGGEGGAFHIIYCRLRSEKLLRGPERSVISQLLQEHPYALFVFSNENQDQWHFVNVKSADDPEDQEKSRDSKKRPIFRRITVGPYERKYKKLRTASERIAMLDLETISPNLSDIPPYVYRPDTTRRLTSKQ